jgi:GT2 family glycosyltransferase
MVPEITISLVSVNQRHDMERLLPSLVTAAGRVRSEILLVDNRSLDGTGSWVERNYPIVNTIYNPGKAGYGANHNLNLQRARGRYFVIMNSDMTLSPEVFTTLQDYMDSRPDVGIVAPKVLNPDGSLQGLIKRYPTVWDLFLRRCMRGPLMRFFRCRIDRYEMRDVGYDRECEVPFLSGAFMFCRSEVLKSLGGFDERYFLYFEDADLCRRVQETHRTMYCPAATVTHFWGRAAHRSWIFSWIFVQSAWRYFRRWGWKLF